MNHLSMEYDESLVGVMRSVIKHERNRASSRSARNYYMSARDELEKPSS